MAQVDRQRIVSRVQELEGKVRQALDAKAEEEAVALLEPLIQLRSRLVASEQQQDSDGALLLVADIEKLVGRYNRLAVSALHQGDLPRALAFLKRAEAVVSPHSQGAVFPTIAGAANTRAQLQATTLNNFACVSRRRGKFAEAIQHLQGAVGLEQQCFGAARPSTLVNLAACFTSDGQPEEAVAQCRAAQPPLRERVNAGTATQQDKQLLVVAWHNMALAQLAIPSEQQAAVQSLTEAVKLAHRHLGTQHPIAQQAEASLAKVQGQSQAQQPRVHQPHPPSDPPSSHRRRRSVRRSRAESTTRRRRHPSPDSTGVRLPALAHRGAAAAADADQAQPAQDGPMAGATFSTGQPMTKGTARETQRRRQSELRARHERRRQQQQQKQAGVEVKKDGAVKKRRRSAAAAESQRADDSAAEAPPNSVSAPPESAAPVPLLEQEPGAVTPAPPAGPVPEQTPLQRARPSLATPAAQPARPSEEQDEMERLGDSSPVHSGPLVPRRVEVSPLTFSDLKDEVREAAVRSGMASRATTRQSPSTTAKEPTQTLTQRRFDMKREGRKLRLKQEASEEAARKAELEKERRRMAAIFAAKEARLRQQQERVDQAARKIQSCFVVHLRRRQQRKQKAQAARMRSQVQQEAVVQRYAELWLRKTEGARALARRLIGTGAGGRGRVQLDVLEKSAVTIQRAWRVKAARLTVQRRLRNRQTLLRGKLERERLRQAATRIQAAYRGRLGRRRAMWTQFEGLRKAARVVWGWWIGMRERIRVHNAWYEDFRRRTGAAVRLQKRWRVFRSRLRTAELKLRKRFAALRDQERRAAVDIQRVARGVQGRKKARAAAEERDVTRAARAIEAAREQAERDSEELLQLQAAAEAAQAEADAKRKLRLPEAEKWREECRQMYFDTVVAREAAEIRRKHTASPPLRRLHAARMLEQERIDALVRYVRVHFAALRIQRVLRSWSLAMTADKRAHCKVFREESRLRRELAAAEKTAAGARAANKGCARLAAEVRSMRQQHEDEIAALEAQGPKGPPPPPRQAEVDSRVQQELEAVRTATRERTAIQQDEITARLHADVVSAMKRGDPAAIDAARARLEAAELLSACWGITGTGTEPELGVDKELLVKAQAYVRAKLARERCSKLRFRQDLEHRAALEWGAARRMQGLWLMRQARFEVVARKQRREVQRRQLLAEEV